MCSQNNSSGNQPLGAALVYCDKFLFSVIPINQKSKKSHIAWKEYQTRRATGEEINGWWKRWPDAMIGVVTGSVSGVVVIDIDSPEGEEAIQEYIPDSLVMPTCRTPGGGKHLYFKHPEKPISNNARVVPGCDFRGDGGYVIAPPSKNSARGSYEWLAGLSLDDVAPPPLPEPYIIFINSFAFKGCENEKIDSHTKAHKAQSLDFRAT